MNTPTPKRRLCFPDGHLPSGHRVRAVCHCGEMTTPRASIERADLALACEHGWYDPPNGCAICGLHSEGRPWCVFKPLDVRDHEVWICQDWASCAARYNANQVAAPKVIAVMESGAPGSGRARLTLVPAHQVKRTTDTGDVTS